MKDGQPDRNASGIGILHRPAENSSTYAFALVLWADDEVKDLNMVFMMEDGGISAGLSIQEDDVIVRKGPTFIEGPILRGVVPLAKLANDNIMISQVV